jgi:hypothetical protein
MAYRSDLSFSITPIHLPYYQSSRIIALDQLASAKLFLPRKQRI